MTAAPGPGARLFCAAAAALAVLAALTGWAAVLFDLYGPTYRTERCGPDGCISSTASLVQVGLTPMAGAFLAGVVGLLLGMAVGGLLLGWGRRTLGLAVSGICLAVLLAATVISGFSVGPSFLPADGLAVLSLISGGVGAGLSRSRS